MKISFGHSEYERVAIGRRLFSFAIVLAVLFVESASSRADEADTRFAAAAAEYNSRHWQAAADGFQAFVKEFPKDRRHAQSIVFLGEARLRLGQFDAARREYQRYLALEPDGKHARAASFRAAEAAYLAGNYDAANPELERFLARRPGDSLNARTLPYLGDIAAAKGDAAAAAGFYREALKQFPNGPLAADCRLALAKAAKKQDQPEPAPRNRMPIHRRPNAAARFRRRGLRSGVGVAGSGQDRRGLRPVPTIAQAVSANAAAGPTPRFGCATRPRGE